MTTAIETLDAIEDVNDSNIDIKIAEVECSHMNRPLRYGISFCGCSFLGMYHVGVGMCLVKKASKFVNNIDKFCGASAGSLAAAVLALAPHKFDKAYEFTHHLSKEIRSKPLGALTPGYNLLDSLDKFLLDILPSDAAERATDRLYISCTKWDTKENVIFCKYRSNEFLMEVIRASCFIPIYSSKRFTKIDGEKYADGGFSSNLPMIDGCDRIVTVSPFGGGQDISPRDSTQKSLFTYNGQNYFLDWRNLYRLKQAFFPPTAARLNRYYRHGLQDCLHFLAKSNFLDEPPSCSTSHDSY